MGIVLILIGVAMIDAKLWKVVLEQRRHDKVMEELLAEFLGRSGPRG